MTVGRIINANTLVPNEASSFNVARRLATAEEQKKAAATPYTEQDWYLRAKIGQIRALADLYSNVPGLDPNGELLKSLQKQATDILTKQRDKIEAKQKEADALKAKLDAQAAENAPEVAISELIRKARDRVNGVNTDPVPKDVLARLDKIKKQLLDEERIGQILNRTV